MQNCQDEEKGGDEEDEVRSEKVRWRNAFIFRLATVPLGVIFH